MDIRTGLVVEAEGHGTTRFTVIGFSRKFALCADADGDQFSFRIHDLSVPLEVPKNLGVWEVVGSNTHVNQNESDRFGDLEVSGQNKES